MAYKLIGLDMDGTLLNTQHEVTESTRKILDQCMEKGIKIVLASGRLHDSMIAFTKHLGLTDEYVSVNGAVITSIKENKKVFQSVIPEKDYAFLLNQLEEIKMPLYVFDSDRYYTDRVWSDLEEIERISGVKAGIVKDFITVKDPTKLLLCFDDPQEIDRLYEKINHPHYSLIRTGYNYIEIVKKGAHKGNALLWIAEKYGFTREEILAIGDSENDLEMISLAGMGIAMGDAAPHIKEAAQFITDTCDHEGVAKAIERFAL